MYRKQGSGFIKHLDFLVLDAAAMLAAYILAYEIQYGMKNPFEEKESLILIYVMMLVQIMVAVFSEGYKEILRRGYLVELKKTIIQNTVVLAVIFSFMFLTREMDYSRKVFFMVWILGIFFKYAIRLCWKRVVRKKVRESSERSRLLIVCDWNRASANVQKLKRRAYQRYRVTGIVVHDRNLMGREIDGVPVIADWKDVFEYVRTEVVDEIFLDAELTEKQQREIVEKFLEMGVVVHINIGWIPEEYPNQWIEKVGECSVVTTSIGTATAYQIFAKRAMDIAGSCLGLLITGILFVIFAPIIYIQSPGPIFFSQTRIGRNGRAFRIYKFRSMWMDAEERKKDLLAQNKMSGLMFKMDNDPRVIPIGRFMRKYSLDEFPQFWNVLRGDMSLVGTRPPTEAEFRQYSSYHKVRLSIKPGLTGMWQVSGRSNITEFEEVVRLDNRYILDWNLKLDLKIIAKTIQIMLNGRGAM